MRMTRYWMTGCMALILLVAGRWPQRDEAEEDRQGYGSRITMTSRYGADETARQIERLVRRSGLPVLLKTAVVPPDGAAEQGDARVLVLGDEGGHTPVLQAEGRPLPQLPLTVLIRSLPDGQTEVSLTDPSGVAPPEGVSAQTLRTVTALPELVRAAIT